MGDPLAFLTAVMGGAASEEGLPEACAALWRACLASPAAPLLRGYLLDTDFAPLGLCPLPAPPLLLSRLAPRWLLGRGLFGSVVLGEDAASRARCAVKQMDLRALYEAPGPEGMGQAHRAQRELRALRLVAALRGAHGARYIVGLQGHCASPCRRWLYLLLEHCPGGDLLRRLQRRRGRSGRARGLPLVEARGHLACLAAALRALHGLGIAHRDIRPSNVAIGGDGLPRLLDFNLCRGGGAGSAAGDPAAACALAAAEAAAAAVVPAAAAPLPQEALLGAAALWCAPGAPHPALPARFHSPVRAAAFAAWCATQAHPPATRPLQRAFTLVGSLVHMAPEVAERAMSAPQHALAADMWSLGVTAYQLLTGKCPGTGAPAWEGEEGAVAGACEGEEAERAEEEEREEEEEGEEGAAPTAQQPFALPRALLAQCPPLQDFLAALCHSDPAQRPTAQQLCEHPVFAHALEAPAGRQAYPEAWYGPVQWELLLRGSVAPLVAAGSWEGGQRLAGAAWGADTFGGGEGSRESAEGEGAVEDPLQAAMEYALF